jgi:hypothetical protein
MNPDKLFDYLEGKLPAAVIAYEERGVKKLRMA